MDFDSKINYISDEDSEGDVSLVRRTSKKLTIDSDSDINSENNDGQFNLEAGTAKSNTSSDSDSNNYEKNKDNHLYSKSRKSRIVCNDTDSDENFNKNIFKKSKVLKKKKSHNKEEEHSTDDENSADEFLSTIQKSEIHQSNVALKKSAKKEFDSNSSSESDKEIQIESSNKPVLNNKDHLDEETSSEEGDVFESRNASKKKNTSDSSESSSDERSNSCSRPVSPIRFDREPTKRKASKNARDEIMKEIYSEKQKMIRGTEISLPYHKPKQRGLKEFLERKKYTPELNTSLKMSMRDMRILRDLEERTKEADTFFKSDSEDDMKDAVQSSVFSDDDVQNEEPSSSTEEVKEKTYTNVKLSESSSVLRTDSHRDKEINLVENPSLELESEEMSGRLLLENCDKKINEIEKLSFDENEIDKRQLEEKELNNGPVFQINGSSLNSDLTTGDLQYTKNSTTNISLEEGPNISDDGDPVIPLTLKDVDESETMEDIDPIIKAAIQNCENFESDSEKEEISPNKHDDEDIGVELTQNHSESEDNSPISLKITENSEISKGYSESENLLLRLDSEVVGNNECSDFNKNLHLDSILSNDMEDKNQSSALKKETPVQSRKISNNYITPKMKLLASVLPDIDKVVNITPKLNYCEGDVIDLDEYPESDAINIMARLKKSNEVKKSNLSEVNLSIIEKEFVNGEEKLVSSNFSVKLNPNDKKKTQESIPGAPLQRLKTLLKTKLLKNREMERQRRVKEKIFLDSEEVAPGFEDELPDDMEDQVTDDDMEDEIADQDSEAESEPEWEGEYAEVEEKDKLPRNEFIDDMADEADDESAAEDDIEDDSVNGEDEDLIFDDDNNSDNDNGSASSKKNKNCNVSDEDDMSSEMFGNIDREIVKSNRKNAVLDSDSDDEVQVKSKNRKVIVSEDEDEEEHSKSNDVEEDTMHLFYEESQDFRANNSLFKKDSNLSTASTDMSFEMIGSLIAPHQPNGGKRKHDCNSDSSKKNKLDDSFDRNLTLFSRVMHSDDEDAVDVPEIFGSQTSQPPPLTQDDEMSDLLGLCSGNFVNNKLKKSEEKPGLSQILGLCSGKFESQTQNKTETNVPSSDMSELLGLCSGKFGNPTQVSANKESPSQGDMSELLGLCSGKFSSSVDSKCEQLNKQLSQIDTQEVQLENGDFSNSIQIDLAKENDSLEEKSDRFRLSSNKLSLPVDNKYLSEVNTQNVKLNQEKTDVEQNSKIVNDIDNNKEVNETANSKKYSVTVGSDDEDMSSRIFESHKRKRRVYQLSDKDDSDSDDDVPKKKIGLELFDDEENPVQKSNFRDKKTGKIRREFLEDEAELSGSDIGSEDEEEYAEDIMEQEEGDMEMFDEDELRNEVGKAHLKSVIDADKREIRLLQELYFEDGDLHGKGRERKFRWKNINMKDDDFNEDRNDSDESEEEIEEDHKHRKERIEREKYLEEKASDLNESVDEVDMPFGSKVKFIVNRKKVLHPNNEKKTQMQAPTNLPMSKRGSLLSRGQGALKKLAEMTKENHSVGGVRGGNFVFASISAEEAEEKKKEKKEKTEMKKPPKPLNRNFSSLKQSDKRSSIFNLL